MALIIEDGSIVEGANSYVTVDEARSYAILRGVTLADDGDDAAVEVLLIKAMDYLETYSKHFVGIVVDIAQPLSWPRNKVLNVDGSTFPANKIPDALKKAQSQLCIEQFNGIDIMPSREAGPFVTRERIDVIQTDYSFKVGYDGVSMPLVESLLSTLTNASFALQTVRV